jgi:hypothetical protein
MADPSGTQALFDAWTKQLEEGARALSRLVSEVGTTGRTAADPLSLWKPLMEQVTDAWTKALRQGVPVADLSAQWKAFLDQWIATWDKTIAQTMQSEAYAKAMGRYLDQWLDAQGPARKAASESMEAALQAVGLPSQNQIVGVSRQLMDLDDRIDDLEDRLTTLIARIEDVLNAREPRPSRGSARRKPGTE